MFDLIFYEDKHGYCDVLEFIKDLDNKSKYSKDARIVRNKVIAYLDILEEMGTQKTPKHEIELARRQLADWTRRNLRL